MNKDVISEILKAAGLEDDGKIEEISVKIENLHGDEVQGLVDNKSEIIAEKKELQSKYKTLTENYEGVNAKLEKFKDITDPGAALKAMEAVKNANLERDVDKEVQEAVQERTRTLIEESTQYKNELERVMREKDEQSELFQKRSREKDFENQITIAAQKANIDPKLMDEYTFNIRKVFNEYDEDSKRFVAKDGEGKQLFGKKQTTKPVDIELYTVDYLIPEKPFFLKGNTNPGMLGNTSDGPDLSDNFYMKGVTAKPTSKGYELMEKDAEAYEIARVKFEKKNAPNKAA